LALDNNRTRETLHRVLKALMRGGLIERKVVRNNYFSTGAKTSSFPQRRSTARSRKSRRASPLGAATGTATHIARSRALKPQAA
jgi:hypothetical protein